MSNRFNVCDTVINEIMLYWILVYLGNFNSYFLHNWYITNTYIGTNKKMKIHTVRMKAKLKEAFEY